MLTGDAPTTSEWSTVVLPNEVWLILEEQEIRISQWWCLSCDVVVMSCFHMLLIVMLSFNGLVMGESFPSPDGIPSRQSRLGPFLWFVQNRWEKFWGIIGGGGSGSWSAVKVRPGWSSTELFTRDASRHFPHLIIISCLSASALQC